MLVTKNTGIKLIKTGKGYIMSDMTEYKGLCLTCNNCVNCNFRQNHNKIIWQCEEYDGSTIRQSKNNQIDKTGSEEIHINSKGTGKGNEVIYKGLCVNCENRFTCIHGKAEGGVWHCENYQ